MAIQARKDLAFVDDLAFAHEQLGQDAAFQRLDALFARGGMTLPVPLETSSISKYQAQARKASTKAAISQTTRPEWLAHFVEVADGGQSGAGPHGLGRGRGHGLGHLRLHHGLGHAASSAGLA